MKLSATKQRGFTLIELLLVIAILSLMASLILRAIDPVKKMSQARDAIRKSQMAQVRDALAAYLALNGSYPSTGGSFYGDAVNWGSYGYEGSNGYIPNLAPGFMKRLPQDPRGHTPGSKNSNCNANESGYMYKSDGKEFKFVLHCTPENYEESDIKFIDPVRDNDTTWGVGENCAAPVAGPRSWAYAAWSSDTSKCW